MRPPSRPQSALRCPLDHILGAEANVRVLRVILLSDIPIGVSELARRTALQPSGVARVCTKLEDLGVIEAVGRGMRNRQYRRASRFTLTGGLSTLFGDERSRADRLFSSLESLAKSQTDLLRAAWIEGPVATGTDGPDDPVRVGVLTDPQHVEAVRLSLGQHLLLLQSQYDVVTDLRVVTAADLATAGPDRRAELETVRPLHGPPPLDILDGASSPRETPSTSPPKDHAQLDARALELARAIADRIRRDPSLVEDARRYLERRLPSASPAERLELLEWQGLLSTMSVPRLCRFLVRDEPRAKRLRQSLPFLNALSPDERRAILDAAGQGQ